VYGVTFLQQNVNNTQMQQYEIQSLLGKAENCSVKLVGAKRKWHSEELHNQIKWYLFHFTMLY